MLKFLAGAVLASEAAQTYEIHQRRVVFNEARRWCDQVGKPLLVIGAPKLGFNHPCGDVTIDLSPNIISTCPYEIADVREIPYPAGEFGAAYISHVLEHLPTVDDAYLALSELHRVADKVFVVSPHKTSVAAWLMPHHHLWVTEKEDGEFVIQQR